MEQEVNMNSSNRSGNEPSLAVFITPHGFGHAARTAAILNAIHQQRPEINFQLYTQVPAWFFDDTLTVEYHLHCLQTDVGLVQKSPLEADLSETVCQLDALYPFDSKLVSRLAEEIQQSDCKAVLCDIAPLGIAVARQAGVPSILVENFTWDWIYAGYRAQEPRFEPFIALLETWFAHADIHVQTIPFCGPKTTEKVSHVVARKPRTTPHALRRKIGLAEDARLVLVTMGGIAQQYAFLKQLTDHPEIVFVVPAASDSFVREENLVLLPHHTPFYHPDLVNASNAVVGKVGYSTLGEVYRAGIPFAYVPRSNFRESPVLTEFIRQNIPGFEIADDEFMEGRWIGRLKELVDLPRVHREEENGADEIARWLLPVIDAGKLV